MFEKFIYLVYFTFKYKYLLPIYDFASLCHLSLPMDTEAEPGLSTIACNQNQNVHFCNGW